MKVPAVETLILSISERIQLIVEIRGGIAAFSDEIKLTAFHTTAGGFAEK